MKKKNFIKAALGLACFSLMPSLISLPTSSEVVLGEATFSRPNESTMVIEASDHAVINYQSFSIQEVETVQFVQPSSSSSVLNRVTGEEASQILGKMQSNGQVFLVNPNGVYFGSGAEVNMGSLVVSTLGIADDDFANGRYVFEGGVGGSIVNEGSLCSQSGSLVLLSDNIHNKGLLVAKAGSVVAAAGQKVTLDFVGNDLVSFVVEGNLEKAVIEQAGSIEALQGKVHLAMGSVREALQNVINTDGLEMGSALVEENGVILLVDDSRIQAKDVEIAACHGSTAIINGDIDVTGEVGGSIHVFAQKISLGEKALINASGLTGGGEILIGGDYQGQGECFMAKNVQIEEGSLMRSDALFEGNGGKVIVWSEGVTRFDGTISAQGGNLSGSGGFVETSGKEGLAVGTGSVNTMAPSGEAGTWLLDPATILITAEGASSLEGADDKYDLTSNLSINPSVFSEVTSNVVLSAMARGGSITIEADTAIVMASGYGIQMDVDQATGQIVLQRGSSIQTAGSTITLNGPVVLGEGAVSLLTNLEGRSGTIRMNSTVNGTADLNLNAGINGKIYLQDAVGANTPIGHLDVEAKNFYVAANITTKGEAIDIRGALTLLGDSIVDTTVGGLYEGADVSFLGKESTINGPFKLFLDTGRGDVNLGGAVGALYPLESFKVAGARTMLSSDLTTDGNTMIFLSPVTLTADVTLTDNGTSGIFFLDTVDGDGSIYGPWQLTANAPIGEVSFIGAVGSTEALRGLIVSANTISQSSSVELTNADNTDVTLTYSGPAGIQVGGDITTTVGNALITMNNPVLFVINPGNGQTPANPGAVTITASSGTTDPASVTLNGIATGSGNLVIVTGAAGATGSVTMQNSAINLVSLSITADSIAQDSNSAIFATGNITLDASQGTSVESLTTAASISTSAGTILLSGGTTTATIASNISAGTGNITLAANTVPISYQGNMETSGGIVTVGNMVLTGDAIINVGDGSVSLQTVNGANDLTVSGSSVANLAFAAAVGGTTPLTSIEASIGRITQASTMAVAGPITYIAPLGIALSGATIATTTVSGTVEMIGPVTLGANVTISTAGAGADILFSGSTSTISSPSVARTLTLSPQATGTVTFGASVGTGDPLSELNVTNGAQVNIASNITVSGASGLTLTPAVVLTGSSTMTALAGPVTFGSTVNGTQLLNINASGLVTFGGIVGGVNYLAGLNVVGSSIAVNTTAVNVVGGATILNGPVLIGADTVFTNNGSGVTFLTTVDGSTSTRNLTVTALTGTAHFGGAVGGVGNIGNVTVSALGIELLGAVTPVATGNVDFTGANSILLAADITTLTTGTITMNNPVTLGTTVTLTAATGAVTLNGVQEGSGALIINTGITGGVLLGGAPYSPSSLSVTSLGAIVQSSASPIATIGDLTLSGTIVTTNASLSSSGGSISITGSTSNAITSNIAAAGGNVTVTGTTTYNGGTISTENGNLTFANAVTLGGDTAINVGSGTARFNSTLTGAYSLSVNGTAIGTLRFGGVVGAAALTSLVAEIGNVIQTTTVTTVGALTYSAASGVTLGGNITTTNATLGTVTIIGPTTLTSGVTITTANPSVLFEGAVSTINGAQTLAFSVGSGNVRLDGAIGFNSALTSLSITSTGTTLVGSDITTSGVQVYGAGGVGTGNIVLTGDSAMNTTNSNITFNGTINGNQNLLVNAGGGAVAYKGVVGGVTPLKSLDTIAATGISISSNMTAR